MANEFSTAGARLGYVAETTAGTMPTSGFTKIPNIKSIPEFNETPEVLDVTDLSDTVSRRGIPGLKSLPDAKGFTCNNTSAFRTAWDTLVTAYGTAKAAGKAIWFEISIPNEESFFFSGAPIPLGIDAMEVGNVAELTAYIIPNTVHGWDTAST